MGVFEIISYLALGLGVVAVAATVGSLVLGLLFGEKPPTHRVRVEIDGRVVADKPVDLGLAALHSVMDGAAAAYKSEAGLEV